MANARPIGQWKMTALVINCIIGSAIFGVPAEAIRLVGNASPLAMLAAAFLMGIVMLPIAEVASQFSGAGGVYLYARTAFGRFVGLQVGWFWLLAIIGGGAAGATLFVTYLARFFPSVAQGWPRVLILLLLIAIPTAVNYLGVRPGLNLSILFTVAKMVPLVLVIGLGLLNAGVQTHSTAQVLPSPWVAWPKLLLILAYAFSGWEDALVPTDEVQQPQRAIPFGLCTGLLVCAVAYATFQLAIVRTIGTSMTDQPVVQAASVLLGSAAGSFVAFAVMLSSYGWLSGAFFNAPRLPVALAQQGDCPAVFGKLDPRFHTPWAGILLYGATVLILALTGSFLWVVALTAGALTIFYSVTCAALIRLRHSQPARTGFRLPFGRLLAILGIIISAALLTQLEVSQIGLMGVTALFGTGNWLWARRREAQRTSVPAAVID